MDERKTVFELRMDLMFLKKEIVFFKRESKELEEGEVKRLAYLTNRIERCQSQMFKYKRLANKEDPPENAETLANLVKALAKVSELVEQANDSTRDVETARAEKIIGMASSMADELMLYNCFE